MVKREALRFFIPFRGRAARRMFSAVDDHNVLHTFAALTLRRRRVTMAASLEKQGIFSDSLGYEPGSGAVRLCKRLFV